MELVLADTFRMRARAPTPLMVIALPIVVGVAGFLWQAHDVHHTATPRVARSAQRWTGGVGSVVRDLPWSSPPETAGRQP
jgi:hypothetical protein